MGQSGKTACHIRHMLSMSSGVLVKSLTSCFMDWRSILFVDMFSFLQIGIDALFRVIATTFELI